MQTELRPSGQMSAGQVLPQQKMLQTFPNKNVQTLSMMQEREQEKAEIFWKQIKKQIVL